MFLPKSIQLAAYNKEGILDQGITWLTACVCVYIYICTSPRNPSNLFLGTCLHNAHTVCIPCDMFTVTLIHLTHCATPWLKTSSIACIKRYCTSTVWPQVFVASSSGPSLLGTLPQSGSGALCPAQIRYSDSSCFSHLRRYTD